MVDLVCDDIVSEKVRRKREKRYIASELDLLEGCHFVLQSYKSAVGSEGTSSYAEEEMEIDYGKTITYYIVLFIKKSE